MRKNILAVLSASSFCINTIAQQVAFTSDQVKAITPDWKGERFLT